MANKMMSMKDIEAMPLTGFIYYEVWFEKDILVAVYRLQQGQPFLSLFRQDHVRYAGEAEFSEIADGSTMIVWEENRNEASCLR